MMAMTMTLTLTMTVTMTKKYVPLLRHIIALHVSLKVVRRREARIEIPNATPTQV